jgi:hypothetical protein
MMKTKRVFHPQRQATSMFELPARDHEDRLRARINIDYSVSFATATDK